MPPTDVLRPRDLPGALIAEQDFADAYRAATASDPVHQARVVWWALGHDPNFEASTAERIGPIIAGFAARQRTLGRRQLADMTSDDATAFIWARRTPDGHGTPR